MVYRMYGGYPPRQRRAGLSSWVGSSIEDNYKAEGGAYEGRIWGEEGINGKGANTSREEGTLDV